LRVFYAVYVCFKLYKIHILIYTGTGYSTAECTRMLCIFVVVSVAFDCLFLIQRKFYFILISLQFFYLIHTHTHTHTKRRIAHTYTLILRLFILLLLLF